MGFIFILMFFGSILIWAAGCLPCYALLTALFGQWPRVLRVLLGMILSAGAVLVIWWFTFRYHTMWVFGLYAMFAVMASFVVLVYKSAKWGMRHGT